MNQFRLYNGTDANFISFASPVINLVKEKHPDFEDFSPHFSPESLKALEVNYHEVNNIPSDNVFIDIQAKATDNVEVAMEKCRKFYKRLKFDVEMAFPDDKNIWNQFGFNDYDKARKSAKHMNVLFTDLRFNDYDKARKSAKHMNVLFTDLQMAVTRYRDPLMANGWTEETFNLVLTCKDTLRMYMDQQSSAMMERSHAAEQRMIKLNKLYGKLSVYFKAARIIYDGNDELLQWFKFPAQPEGKKEKQEEAQNQQNN